MRCGDWCLIGLIGSNGVKFAWVGHCLRSVYILDGWALDWGWDGGRANGRAIIVQCLCSLSCVFEFVACFLSLSFRDFCSLRSLTSPFPRGLHYRRRRYDLDTDCKD